MHSKDQEAVLRPLVQERIQDDYALTIQKQSKLNPGVVDMAVQGLMPRPKQTKWDGARRVGLIIVKCC